MVRVVTDPLTVNVAMKVPEGRSEVDGGLAGGETTVTCVSVGFTALAVPGSGSPEAVVELLLGPEAAEPVCAPPAPVLGKMLSVTCGPIPGAHCPKTRVMEPGPTGAAVTVVVGIHVVVITPRFDWYVLLPER